ncbi:MAG: hypothetical protein AAFY71_25180 [Bacteroidota bacterium]
MKFYSYILLLLVLALVACEPSVVEKSELGPVPSPTFEITQGATPNEFVLTNTTEGAFLTKWEIQDNGTAEGNQATITISFKGDYEVKMTTFARGGSAETMGSLTVTQDDPNACFGNFELLTNCGEKIWTLANEENALHIGPNLTETWWGNSSQDLADRPCHFNDQYIFRSNGEYEYRNNGDFWADTDGNGVITPADLGLSPGCQQASDWPEKYKAWDSGIHTFSVNQESLSLNGEGAWIGLYKIGTAGEVTEPQQSVTLSILELTNNRMVLFADYGWGVWRLTLTSN